MQFGAREKSERAHQKQIDRAVEKIVDLAENVAICKTPVSPTRGCECCDECRLSEAIKAWDRLARPCG